MPREIRLKHKEFERRIAADVDIAFPAPQPMHMCRPLGLQNPGLR